MAEPIDVAFVEVRPDTRGFGAETRRQLSRELRGVEQDIGIGGTGAARRGTLGETLLGTAIGADLGIKASEKDIAKLGSTSAATAKSTGQLSSALSVMGGTAARAGQATRVAGVGGAAIATAAFLAARSAIAFEDSFAGVRKTVDATEPQLAQMSQELLDLSTVIPVNVNELNNLASAAGQLGIQTDAIIAFTDTVAKLGVTTDLTSDIAADALARLANITQLPQDQFDNLGSTIVALGNKTASTESEIVDFGLRISGAGNQIGLTQDQILSFGAALASLGLNAEAGGSAISTTFIRIASDVAKGGERLNTFARVAGMSADEFSKKWRTDPANAIVAFLRGLSQVNDQGGNVFATLEELGLGGIRVRDTLLRAAGAGDLLSEALRIGSVAWTENNALQREAAIRFDTTKSRLIDVKNEANALAVELGTLLLPAVNALAGGFEVLFKGTRIGVRALKGLFTGDEFDPATANVEEFAKEIAKAQEELDFFSNNSGFESLVASQRAEVEALEDQLVKMAAALDGAGKIDQAFAGFAAASADIERVMEDGLITPMERAELQTSSLGRAFVRMLDGIANETRGGILDAVAAAGTVGTRLGEALATAIRNQRANVRNAVLDTVPGLQGQTAGFGEQFDIATAAGDEQGQLAALKQQAKRQQAIIDRVNKASGGDPTDALLKARRQAQSNLASLSQQIKSIEDSIQAEKDQDKADREAREKKDADDAAERVRKANQNALSIRNTNVELARLTTDRVDDDRIAYGSLIKELRRQLALVGAASAEGRSLLLQIKQAKGELSDALTENADAEVQAREEFLRDQLTLAQLTGGTGEKALKRLETFYEKQVAASKAGSVARRKWRIELERVRKELRDIADEEGKTTGTAKALQPGKMFFEFMQTQQGFVSNLLSNLIPSGSTAGLVGGTAFPGGSSSGVSPSDALVDLEAERAARGPRAAMVTAGVTGDGRKGMTTGQAQTLISLNRQMLGVLKDVHRGTGHPESRAASIAAKASMDYGV